MDHLAQLTTAARARRHQPRAGIALSSALIALALVAVLVSALFRMTTSEARAVAARESAARAILTAEEGAAHAVMLLRTSLVNHTFTQLLRGPDNVANTADDGLLTWPSVAAGIRIPSTGKATTGGTYTVKIVDDPAETDNNAFVDANYRVLIQCRAVMTDGSQAGIDVIVAYQPPLPAMVANGNWKLSGGNMRLKGSCGSVHANGNIDLSGTLYAGSTVSASGSVAVGGSLRDSLGASKSPSNSAGSVSVPDLNPMDDCAGKDFRLYKSGSSGYLYQKSTNQTFNITSNAKYGWKMSSSSPVVFTLSGDYAVNGSVCIDGNVVISGNPGSAGNPLKLSLYASGTVEISGNPYLTPAPGDSVSIMAGGDLKIGGNPNSTTRNFEGLLYAESQCLISGNPRLQGQLICQNKPNAAGTVNSNDLNEVGGDIELTFGCTNTESARRRIVSWIQPIQ